MLKLQYISLTMLVLFSTSISFSQDMKKHEWKNRVLLLLSKDLVTLEKQIKMLSQDIPGIKERKLVVYKILPKKYSEGLDNDPWKTHENFYKQMKKTKKEFEVILIGLDGGIKLIQHKPISLDELFSVIDQMPIRRREIKNKS